MNRQLLEELIAFEKYGTLVEVAKHLSLTQPTVTRGMKKLEEELAVSLFVRKPNKIELTETGELAAKEARKVLQAEDDFIRKIQQFASQHQVLKIASTEPGPRFLLEHLELDYPTRISPTNLDQQLIEESLQRLDYDVVISHHELHTEDIESIYLGAEQLAINVDEMTVSSQQQRISFSELDGLSFIVLENIGIWSEIIQQSMPKAKFLYQQSNEALVEILAHSKFPYFTTNLTHSNPFRKLGNNRRKLLLITDDTAKVDFYISYRKEERTKLRAIVSDLQAAWPRWTDDNLQ